MKTHLSRWPILLALALGCGIAVEAVAADADLQQYNGSAVWNSDLTAASTLLPRDGKLVTADNNAAGKAPVNRSLKQIKDLMLGMHDGIFGSRGGSQLRTVRSLQADAAGGNANTAADGDVRASGAVRAGTSLFAGRSVVSSMTPTPAAVVAGEYPKDGAPAAMGSFDSVAGTLLHGYGVYSATKSGTGAYTVVMQAIPSGADFNNSVVMVTPDFAASACNFAKALDGSNRLKLLVVCGANANFDFVAWVF